MTHTYTVSGMTCNGCKKSVEDALFKLDAIQVVQVKLYASEATITITKATFTENSIMIILAIAMLLNLV